MTAAPDGQLILSAAEVAQYAYQAGFRGEALITAVAIAHAESGFDAHNVGDVNLGGIIGQQSTGLWQINYQPKRDGSQASRNPTANLDPATNARNAYTISGGGTNFHPWSTYTNGAYKQYLPEARTAQSTAASGVTADPAPASSSDSGQPILAITGGESGPVLPLTIGGRAATGELGEAIVGGTVDFSVNAISEITVDLDDDRAYTLHKRYKLQPDGTLHLFDLPYRVVSYKVAQAPGGPRITLTAQPEGVVQMNENSPGSRTNISPTDYMQQVSAAAGLKFIGEASAVAPSVGPAQIPDMSVTGLFTVTGTVTAMRPETAWEVGQRLAAGLGFYAYESAGTYYFASAFYLTGRGQYVQVSTDGEGYGPSFGPQFDALGLPTCTITKRPLNATATKLPAGTPTLTTDLNFLDVLISGSVDRDAGVNLRPGMRARWTGIGPLLSGVAQIITRVSWDLKDLTTPVRVECGSLAAKVGSARTAADDAASTFGTSGTDGSTLATVIGPKPTILDFVTECVRQAGKKYVWGAEDPAIGFDCSSLIQWAARQLNVTLPRTAGPQFAAVQKAGLTMSIDQAFHTRGAVLYRNPSALPGYGEHIVVSLGDGKHTIEARGAAYGVVEGPITGRIWTGAGKLPGFTY